MPIYEYTCTACEHTWDARRSVAERDESLPCPECEINESMRATVYEMRFNLPGDDWPSKNDRVGKQMASKNTRLSAKEEEMKRDAPGMALAPNVAGERTASWVEAQKLAKSKGLNTESYEPMVRKEAALKKAPTVKS
jgi:putative FmdB family regulatory protein